MKYNLKNSAQRGFSLVEMLIVIAVIGVIAAIAIPNIGSINASATAAKNQRNAQSIVSVYQAGSAAGVLWDNTNAGTAIADVIKGEAPADGAFSGKTFQVPSLSGTDVTGASAYITLTTAGLVYNKTLATTP